jgi:hypothetical protein
MRPPDSADLEVTQALRGVSTGVTSRSVRQSPTRGGRRGISTRCSSPMASCWKRRGGAVADELGLPAWWLNEQASVYVARGGDPAAPRVFDHPGLRVSAASPEHLLAMKVLAARRRDAEDIRFLVEHLRLASADDVLALCADVFPDEDVPAPARLVIEDVFGQS